MFRPSRVAALFISVVAPLLAALPAPAAVTGSLVTTVLSVNLGANGDHGRVTTNGGNIEVWDDVAVAVVFSTPIASVNTLVGQGNNTGAQTLVLDGTLSLPGGVLVTGVDILQHQGDYDVGAGDYNATANQTIVVQSGANQVAAQQRITGTGAISLQANQGTPVSGAFPGIVISNASISTPGALTINGTGGDTGNQNAGVAIVGGSVVANTGSGTLQITGVSFGAGQANIGVVIDGSGTTVTSTDGALNMNGTGGPGTGNGNYGVVVQNSAQIVGTGASAVALQGIGGGTGASTNDDGILIQSNGIVSVANGSALLVGVPGNGAAVSSYGVDIAAAASGGAILSSGSAGLTFAADSVAIDPTAIISAGANTVTFLPTTVTVHIDVGGADAAGTLGLTNAELSRVGGSSVQIGSITDTGGITVSSAIAPPVASLSLQNAGPFAGPGGVTVTNLTLVDGSIAGNQWTILPGTLGENGNAPLTYGASTLTITGGGGSDTFNVQASSSTAIAVNGGNPQPPTVPGDVLNILPGPAITSSTATNSASGYSGTVSFTGAQPVTFSQMESGNTITTQLTGSAPATAQAGVAFTVTVTALDPAGNVASAYNGTVHFTSTDGSAILPADSTLTNGSGTFSVTLRTLGSQTVTATDTLNPALTITSGTITVGPGPATHYTGVIPTTATAGTAFSFSVSAVDQFGNVDTNYSGTVHFTSTDGGATLPADSTLTNGTGTFSATLVTAGSQTLTATDTVSPSITATSAAIAVSPGAATHYGGSVPGVANAGVAFSITVTALDAFGNTVPTYSGTVHFTSTDGLAVLPANSTLTSGTGTFSVTLNSAGSQTVTATDTVTSSITTTSGAILVSAGGATHFTVSAPASATSGTSFSFTVTALDATNNVATGYSGTVHFTSSDGAAILPANSTLASGVGTFSATLATGGNQTLTATDSVTSAITGTSGTIAVSAGAATHFTVTAPASAAPGVAFSFTVTARDATNNVATGYSGTVHFTSSDGAASLPANSTLASGVGTMSATLNTAGSQTITATDTVSAGITGTSGSITVSVNNTFSGPSATGTGTITASFTGGGAGCAFSAPQFIAAPPGSPPVPPTKPTPATSFPEGMFNYSLVGCTPGSTITMTIVYPQSVTGLVYYKYGPEASNPAPHWYVMPASISGNTITFSITDGGKGDDDMSSNGTIVDPGGPGTAGAIPALSPAMLVLLGLLTLVAAATSRRAFARSDRR
jgi:hypothetical protein